MTSSRILKFFICLAIGLPIVGNADPKTDKILGDSAKTVATTVTEQLIKGYLDKLAADGAANTGAGIAGSGADTTATAANAGEKGAITVGSEFIFAVQLG